MVNNAANAKLKECFETKHGIKFYCHINPLEVSALRGLAAEKAKRYMDLNITERSLKQLLIECKTLAGSNDLVGAFSIIQEIEYRVNFLSEEHSILDLSSIYFFLEDEDPEEPSEVHNRKKHAIFEQDHQAKVFFLRIGLGIAKKYSQKQEDDTLSYLEDNKILSERIRRYIAPESQLNSIST